MNAFPILARRELLRHRGLFAAALALGLFAALMPYFQSAAGSTADERRGAAAVGLAALWSFVVAVGLGASALTRRHGNRPLGFDLRLPASPTAIWSARLGAAYVATIGTGALVLAVAATFGIDLELAGASFDVFANEATSSRLWIEGWLALSPLLLAFVLLLAHFGELALAGERALAALELVAVVLAKGAVWYSAHELLEVFAYGGVRRLVIGALALAVVVLVATSHRQLVRGRDDRRAAHRAATPVLVAGALAIAVVSPLYVRWYLNPSPAAVVGTPVAVPIDAPDLEPWVVPGWTSRASELGGGWRMITGRAAGRHPETWFTWLVHDDDRRALLLRRSPAFVERGFRRAANAQRIAWLTSSRVGGAGTVTLHYADLDRGEVEPKATRWSWTGLPVWRFAADGESIEILVARDAWKRLPLPPR